MSRDKLWNEIKWFENYPDDYLKDIHCLLKRSSYFDIKTLFDYHQKTFKKYLTFFVRIYKKRYNFIFLENNEYRVVDFLTKKHLKIIIKAKDISIIEKLLQYYPEKTKHILSRFKPEQIEKIIYPDLIAVFQNNIAEYFLLNKKYIPKYINSIICHINYQIIQDFYLENKNKIKNKLNFINLIRVTEMFKDPILDFKRFSDEELLDSTKMCKLQLVIKILKIIKDKNNISEFLIRIYENYYNHKSHFLFLNKIFFQYKFPIPKIKIQIRKYNLDYLLFGLLQDQFTLLEKINPNNNQFLFFEI